MRWIYFLLSKYTLWRARRNPVVNEFINALSGCMKIMVPGEPYKLVLVSSPKHPFGISITCVDCSPRAQVAWSELQDALELEGIGQSEGPNLHP